MVDLVNTLGVMMCDVLGDAECFLRVLFLERCKAGSLPWYQYHSCPSSSMVVDGCFYVISSVLGIN